VTVILPPGYVSILQAADILEQSLFAGLPDKPIILRYRQAGLAVGDGAARDQAITELWEAVDAKKLHAMAFGGRPRRMVRLDPALTKQIPWLRSPRGRGFTALRPSNPAFHSFAAWFGPHVADATLAFCETEIQRLGRRLMRARRRSSRSNDTKRRTGRPSRQAEVCVTIRNIVEKEKWSPLSGLKALTKETNREGKWAKPVSEDTVARALDWLYENTQDRRFERRKKR
jgi:hypothetical protein